MGTDEIRIGLRFPISLSTSSNNNSHPNQKSRLATGIASSLIGGSGNAVPTISSTMMKNQAQLKFQWNQSRYQRWAPMTRQVEFLRNRRQKRRKYSMMETPPRQAVLTLKTAFWESEVRYQRVK